MTEKCIKCGRTENDKLAFDNDRTVMVTLVKSRYGLLCQRHVRNAYSRQMTTTKRQRRKREEREKQEQAGQMSMFD